MTLFRVIKFGGNGMKTIFVVDDNNINLLTAKETLSSQYNVVTLGSAALMFDFLENSLPDLILMDIMMPEMDGFEALKLLRENKKYMDIPVIFLSGKSDIATESRGFEMGVVDFIAKPFSRPILLNRIKAHLRVEDIIRERTTKLTRLKNSLVTILANIVESRDNMTGGHIERTTKYIRMLLTAMLGRGVYADELAEWDIDMAVSSSRLHDIGKVGITDMILNKPFRLEPGEFEIIKTHVPAGEKIIDSIMEEAGDELFLRYAKLFAGYHHDWWDGNGYPHSIKGEEIPLQGRIMAIVDVYDALVSDRPYKKAFPHEEAVRIITEGRGIQFDPKIVDVFLEISDLFEGASKCQ
jgi:putative two-component system response regulator